MLYKYFFLYYYVPACIICTHTNAQTYSYTHIYMHIPTQMHKHTHACMHVLVCLCICVGTNYACRYIIIYKKVFVKHKISLMHTHAHMHAQTHIMNFLLRMNIVLRAWMCINYVCLCMHMRTCSSVRSVTLFQIHLYGDNLEKLHENIPPEILPEDFGGRLPAFSNTVSQAKCRQTEYPPADCKPTCSNAVSVVKQLYATPY